MAAEDARYTERLIVAWWMWPAALAAAGLMAAEVHLGYDGLRSWVPYAVLLPLTLALLAWLSRLKIEVRDGELWVDDAHVPASLLTAAEALEPAEKQRALGRDLHPFAFVVHRPWVRRAALILLDDPEDPTPYWIVSSRRPEALIAALGLPGPQAAEDSAADGPSVAGR
jgi:hypothetical protein